MYLHQDPNFKDLIDLVSVEHDINAYLVEKDYWIMHCLYGLSTLGLSFELKGGTSLSKAFGVIHRFSEDLDIKIYPNQKELDFTVYTGKNHDKEKHRESRKQYFDWLCSYLKNKIDGIVDVVRDPLFDDHKFRNGGIRLIYNSQFNAIEGIKEGILLELGFEQTSPHKNCTISSWAFDFAQNKQATKHNDNRAIDIPCYLPEYTFVEKLHAIVTKYLRFKEDPKNTFPTNFIRHYYDIYCLLELSETQSFIKTIEYTEHKNTIFKSHSSIDLKNFEGFILSNQDEKDLIVSQYKKTKALYYKDQISFEDILKKIQKYLP